MLASLHSFEFETIVSEESIGQKHVLTNDSPDYIKQIALFNCSKIGKKINNVLVEYHFEIPSCNEVKFGTSSLLISSITVLNDSPNILAVFTDISEDVYKYKKYKNNEKRKLCILTLENKKHITYNASNACLFMNRNSESASVALFMNIFESSQEQHFTSLNVQRFNEIEIRNVEINNKFNFEFYQNLLYKNNKYCMNFIWMILDEGAHTKNIEFAEVFDINVENYKKLKIKYGGNLIEDIVEMNNFKCKSNRFYQRFQIKNVLSKKTCNWFVDETEKYAKINGWKTDNFKKHVTNDVSLSYLKPIHDYFFNHELENIINMVEKMYCLPSTIKYEIANLNIIKYSDESISGLEKHTDSSFITFNISLNDESEYEGGGTCFNDGLTFKNEIGEMLIHCGKMDHVELPVKKGARYILVGLMNIKYEM